jgi:ElaA protein
VADSVAAVPSTPASFDQLRVREASFDDLDPRTLYEILRLRIDVFVVEQACAFGDLDGRDLEPTARHLWLELDRPAPGDGEAAADGPTVVAYARLLDGPGGGTEIGGVVTPGHVRGTGVGRRLMREAMARIEGPIYLKAQSRKSAFYASFGFVVVGDEFLEDGIPHVPMRHPGT